MHFLKKRFRNIFKAADLQMLIKYNKWKKELRVNTCHEISLEKSIITDPLIQLTKSLVKHRFSLHNQLRY